MHSTIEKKNIISITFTFLVMTMPIINNYASPIPSIGLSEFILLLSIPLMCHIIILYRKKILLHRYWLYFFYGITSSLVILLLNSKFSVDDVVDRLLRDTFYVFLVLLFAQIFFDVKYAIKLYKKLTIITCVYLILQCISFYVFDVILPWLIPGLDLNFSTVSLSAYLEYYKNMYLYYFRPNSIFMEPAQFAQFVTPYLVLLLFPINNKDNINYKLAILVSISLLLSTSANAYVLLFVIWSIWYIYSCIQVKEHKKIVVFFVVGISFIIALFLLYKHSAEFNRFIMRLNNIGNGESGSGNVRLLRGAYFFGSLDSVFKIFGIGFGNFSNFSSAYFISTLYDIGTEYMNSLSYILVSSGIVGLVIFLWVLYCEYKKGSLSVKILVIILLLMFLSSSIYSSPIYVILLTFILYLPKNKIEESN